MHWSRHGGILSEEIYSEVGTVLSQTVIILDMSFLFICSLSSNTVC